MTEFAKMDVFFFVTTIAVAILAIGMIVLVVYSIKILNDIKYITTKAKTEADHIAEDLDELRSNLRTKGSKLKYLGYFGKFLTGVYKRRRKS